MPKISIEDMTPEQQLVIQVLVDEGKLRAFEELLEYFEDEYNRTATEDPYYGYYVKHVIEKINELYLPLAKSVDG